MEKITKGKILIVEGEDEKRFFKEFLNFLGISDVQILKYDGKNNLKNRLKVWVRDSNFRNVNIFGIIIDADNNSHTSFQSVCDILRNVGLKPPQKMYVFSDGYPRIGVYIMPGNFENGMLEDLCIRTVKNCPLIQCVDNLIECAKNLYNNGSVKRFFESYEYFKQRGFYRNNFSNSNGIIRNIAKAKALAYLSIMPEIVYSVGVGAEKGYWNFESEELNELRRFLEYFR
ncbi:DUF3226 domain-containing protein [Methanotorris igneus]|uniref:DUF4435 domain-containing protein n=1 Tax=Methanotorris igneus (strain DSM 5666 / JCM 11834 / Kol 5) TaxID=880724 RepID=F6BB13_METIK|nr:DUF3226 domain-containing protein [Methanotorris igneus]AEF97100.1 hypothetical protein Metig_1566 [Methanotorris igneus Kol 5]